MRILITKPDCPRGDKLRRWFQKHEKPFNELLIGRDIFEENAKRVFEFKKLPHVVHLSHWINEEPWKMPKDKDDEDWDEEFFDNPAEFMAYKASKLKK